MKAIIIADGNAPTLEFLQQEIDAKTIVICADGGANCLFRYQIIPQYIVGDFDSILPEALDFFRSQKVLFEKHPCAKDATDTYLALQKALRLNLSLEKIIFLGCLGGIRIDHLLGNFGLLDVCLQAKVPAVFKDQYCEVTLIDGTAIFCGYLGQTFSVLAYSDVVTNLCIVGGKYNLQGHDLHQGSALTISNEFLANEIKITFDSGKLLVIKIARVTSLLKP